MGRRHKSRAASATFPDDAVIDGGANYDIFDPLFVADKDPGMRYYFAANDGDKMRPDGAHRLLSETAYEKSERQHSSPDCILLEMPMDKWRRREELKRRHNADAMRGALEPPDGLETLKDHRHGAGR